MNGPTYDLPSDIGELGKKSFSTPLLEEGLRLFRTAKTMLSFKKGSPDNYYIVSGIVRTHRSFETKVVYKKRLEDSGQPPLTSNCDCHQWKTNEHCSHVVCLFLHYHLQLYLQKSGSSGILLPDSIPVNNFAVRPQHYGTIIPGPSKLLGASPNSTYSTQQYLLTDGRIINFPVPAPFNGKMIIWIDTSTLITEEDLSRQVPVLQFKYQGTEGPLVSEISLFEGLYLFNWNDGQAYHLPREINEFVQGRRNSTEEITLENLINIGYSWQQKNLAEVIIDSQSLSQMPQENGQMQIHVRPANEGSDLLFSAVFHDQQKNKISPPSILPALTFEGGLLGTFHSKKDAYRFLSSLAYCFEEKSHAYKKQLIGNKFRTQWSRLIASVLEGSHCLIYDHLLKKTYLFDNEIIKAFYSALWKNFHELFFRYSCYEQETREIQFQISPRILFEGLASFYERVIPLGIGVFYQLGEISHWAPRIRFERRLSSTQWFDLDLQISALDLEVIGKTQLDSRLVLTKKGLVYLSPEQKDLIRFMKKYTQHEGQPVDLKKEKVDDLTETTKEELKDEDIRKFAIPFNRSRIFELFELKKFGLDGALTEAEQELCRRLSTLTDMPEYPIPSGLESILRPYQKIGYQWLRFLHENMLGACLADDMGLGKTLQAIAFIESIYDSIQRVLIVCPVTLLLNWEKEFAKFGTLHPVLYHGGERIFPQDSKIILTSYGVIKKDIDGILVEQHFDILILDEVQHLKNLYTLGANAARRIKANFRICLTGTPVENDLAEFYNILDLSVPGVWGDLRFIRTISNTKTRLLARKTASPFILRRTKGQVLTELPPKLENTVYLNFTDIERGLYQQNLIRIRNHITTADGKRKYGEILKGLLQLRQNCLWQKTPQIISSKISFLMDTLGPIMEEGHQAIVFSQFTTYLDIIQNIVHQKHWKFSRIDGSQSIKKRQQQVDLFQERKHPLFLISLKAGGVGLNLTAASYVFVMDPWWNPAVENQAIDRAHRIGQKNTLTVYRPIIKDSVEEKVLQLQEMKKELFYDLLPENDDAYFSGKLTMRDFETLFN